MEDPENKMTFELDLEKYEISTNRESEEEIHKENQGMGQCVS